MSGAHARACADAIHMMRRRHAQAFDKGQTRVRPGPSAPLTGPRSIEVKLVVVPPALAELHNAAVLYPERANLELGLAFMAEFERTANLVLDNPFRRGFARGARMARVDRDMNPACAAFLTHVKDYGRHYVIINPAIPALPTRIRAPTTIFRRSTMANITRFDPFDDIARFSPLANIDDLFKGLRLRSWPGEVEVEPRIKVDVAEDDKAYTVKADIPGAKKEDIHVAIEGSRVSIETEVKREKEEKKGEKVVRSERYFGKQYRGFTLGQDIDSSKAEAKYQDGVLELTLPKTSNGSARELKIQ